MTTPGDKLSELIKKAIADFEITPSEYDAILAQANEDKIIDSEEKALLQQFHEMIANGTVKRVREKKN